MTKLGFTGLALAGCLALASCSSTSRLRLASAFNYPEANAYVSCFVDHARKRALGNKQQLKNQGIDAVLIDTYDDCEAVEMKFRQRARADGISTIKLVDFTVELRTKASDLAWDEVARIRLAQLKAEGAVR
ncbi:hypothetical protein [Pleomorphomonas koreensis]|uniref:hypothetical protein n=1 Tax=Pleomorphomonas koreensis TaxID=257440 RepID=UPI0003FBEF00|nr:hypothetical protein [Pleomorphomonas koreensis]